MHPIADIVVLVHNQLGVTKNFVQHLFANTQNFNLIFVDNGSTDGTPQYLKAGEEQNKWSVVRPGKNLGIICGRNLGAIYVRANYFVNLDNDQLVGPGWLDLLFDKLNEGYDIVGIDAWQLLPPGSDRTIIINGQTIKDSSYFPVHRCVHKDEKFSYVGCGGCLIKKKVYDDIGLFDERYGQFYFEDPDYCYEAIKNGYKIAWLHGCPVLHLSHQTINNQTSYDKRKEFADSWLSFKEKWYPYFPDFLPGVKDAT